MCGTLLPVKVTVTFMLCAAVAFVLSSCGAVGDLPIRDGRVDLSGTDLDSIRSIRGTWEVYPGEALYPQVIAGVEQRSYSAVPPRDGRYVTGTGQRVITGPITYRLQITGIPTDQIPALSLPAADDGISGWVNGKLVRSVPRGRASVDVIVPIPAAADGSADLVVIVYNSGFTLAGIATTPAEIASLATLTRRNQMRFLRDGVLLGALVIMALYHLMLLFAPGRDIPHLPFFFVCLAAMVRVASLHGQALLPMLPLRLVGLAIYPLPLLYLWYLRRMFPVESRRNAIRFISWTGVLWLIASVVLPPARWLDLFYGYIPIMLFFLYTVTALLSRAVRGKRSGARLVLVGFLALVVGILLDIARARGLVQQDLYATAWAILLLCGTSSVAVSLRVVEFRISLSNLKEQAQHDGLTGLFNRRTFDSRLVEEWQRHLRSQRSMALLMLDVDHFKEYNDTQGHPAGDEVLRRIAAILSGNVQRLGDIAARYGGEEFAVILPDTDVNGAYQLGLRICSCIRGEALPHPAIDRGVITVSIGVAGIMPDQRNLSLQDPKCLVQAADAALYDAKHAGRDAVHTAAPQVITGCRDD